MSQEDGLIETELLDLGHYMLRDLRVRQDEHLRVAVEHTLSQVTRPRKNIGNSGPPGRAD